MVGWTSADSNTNAKNLDRVIYPSQTKSVTYKILPMVAKDPSATQRRFVNEEAICLKEIIKATPAGRNWGRSMRGLPSIGMGYARDVRKVLSFLL